MGFRTNEAPPQTDEMYWFLAEFTRLCKIRESLCVLGPCVRSIRHAVGDARDAVFDQGNVEIDEQAQALVCQPQMRQ
jgi:hypothetical protein